MSVLRARGWMGVGRRETVRVLLRARDRHNDDVLSRQLEEVNNARVAAPIAPLVLENQAGREVSEEEAL